MDKKEKKDLKKQYQSKPKLTKEQWEEAMLENDSYYDIDMLNDSKQIERLKKKVKKYGK